MFKAKKLTHSPEWCIFGGNSNPGESALEAAIRETHEESGGLISLKKNECYSSYTFEAFEFDISLNYFEINLTSEKEAFFMNIEENFEKTKSLPLEIEFKELEKVVVIDSQTFSKLLKGEKVRSHSLFVRERNLIIKSLPEELDYLINF